MIIGEHGIMKIRCAKEKLVTALNIVSKAVPSKTTMSILQCILVDSTNGNIKFTSNDTELGIETYVEGEILEKGIVAIDAKIFFDIVRKLPDNDVLIQTSGDFITTITCEKSKFNIVGKSGEEFTYLPSFEKNDNITISQFTLKELVRQTIFCIAENDNNKIMTGVLFEINGDSLRVVALDGHRIAIRNVKLRDTYENKRIIVPGKTLNEISKILSGDNDKMVDIYFTPKNIIFEFDDTTVMSRLIEGEYFNVNQMLSADYVTKVSINKKEFLSSIDRATLLVKEGDKKPIIISINDEQIEIKINSAIGSMNESIDITKEGKDMMIGFNPRFVIDALRVIDDETIDIYMLNPKAPCFIKDEEENYTYLILPVNFNSISAN